MPTSSSSSASALKKGGTTAIGTNKKNAPNKPSSSAAAVSSPTRPSAVIGPRRAEPGTSNNSISSSSRTSSYFGSSAVVAHLSQRNNKSGGGTSGSAAGAGGGRGGQQSQQRPQHHHPHQPPPHNPYSSLSLSPCRNYAVTAGKDVLQVVRLRPTGLQTLKTVPAALYFQHPQTQTPRTDTKPQQQSSKQQHLNLRDFAFGASASAAPSAPSAGGLLTTASSTASTTNVVITDVAWSHTCDDDNNTISSGDDPTSSTTILSSLIAAAGSNGVIVVWSAATLLEGTTTGIINSSSSSNNVAAAAPEAVLSQHARAVNRLAWHPTVHGRLLSASQDSTVLLWERRRGPSSSSQQQQQQAPVQTANPKFKAFFGLAGPGSIGAAGALGGSQKQQQRASCQWICTATFSPKSEAVRDIRWSPFYDDVFAAVTGSGSLIVYNRRLSQRAVAKLTGAHSGDATCVDWHPRQRHLLATGGASDRCVKIWDLESDLSVLRADSGTGSGDGGTVGHSNGGSSYSNLERNANTQTSRADSIGTADSSTGHDSQTQPSLTIGPASMITVNSRTMSSSSSWAYLNPSSSRHKAAPKNLRHVLSISASVTRLRWRPPANDTLNGDADDDEDEDRHHSMLAVATAPIKGASAGGSGMLALWSYYRPYMPLSVVEGHRDGAVTDFAWLDTPLPPPPPPRRGRSRQTRGAEPPEGTTSSAFSSRLPGTTLHDVDSILYDNSEQQQHRGGSGEEDDPLLRPVGIWQHVLSVGRDGRCLIQSFARGDRPISRVPPSCFAMANLSPFQKGYGSLQFFSVSQTVPSGPASDFLLAGLRRDKVTATALGVFREMPPEGSVFQPSPEQKVNWKAGKRLPESSPELVFNVVDQGDLDEESNPIGGEDEEAMIVAPEVVHLSRFASRYKLYPDQRNPSRVDLCLHNADVADSLRSSSLAYMWRMIASMLESTGLDGLPDTSSQKPQNVMQFVILPTIKSLLEERADAGDVQTCVALCEVLEVIRSDQTVRIPDLEINLIREWYLSYIDLLRDMCLFSDATFLIRSCKDPYVGALNQQSTTIHESCPHCGKALLHADGDTRDPDNTFARRACKSCRRRVGLCFLCHEPVKGVYVWCPGCGHGGHLSHALQWFGGLSGKEVREVCPTGCGHRCNLVKELSAFPRTESIDELAFGEYCEPIGMG